MLCAAATQQNNSSYNSRKQYRFFHIFLLVFACRTLRVTHDPAKINSFIQYSVSFPSSARTIMLQYLDAKTEGGEQMTEKDVIIAEITRLLNAADVRAARLVLRFLIGYLR